MRTIISSRYQPSYRKSSHNNSNQSIHRRTPKYKKKIRFFDGYRCVHKLDFIDWILDLEEGFMNWEIYD